MDEMIVYAPLGMLGYGFPIHSLENAMKRNIQAMAMDAGSTDPGPYFLGAGVSFTAKEMVKRDLGLILPAARSKGVPLIIGSAGGAGGNIHLKWTLDILRDIAVQKGLHFKLATISGEVEKGYVKDKLARGLIFDFELGKPLNAEEVDRSVRIVAQMGVEPIIRALDEGAEVILAGRAFDAALVAAVPIRAGFDPGLALHMGKILECGALVALPRESDGMLGILQKDHFLVEPADPYKRCTVETVAAHSLYEKSDPVYLDMPGGRLDLSNTRFERWDNRMVRVSGSRFLKREKYFLKLEGARRVGFRTVCIAGARDPILLLHLDEVVDTVKTKIKRDLQGVFPNEDYQILYHLYGRDGVMGALEPQKKVLGHEVGVVIEVVARTRKIANTIAALARSATLHTGYEGRKATAGNLAFLFSPAEFPAPEVYAFNVYHLMEVDDPCEMFSMQIEDL